MIFSASSVSTFEACPRKWAFDKIDGIPREESPAATLGKLVHSQLERWLRDATPPDDSEAGRIADSALHLLPQPKTPGMTLEQHFEIEIGGYQFHGYKDVQLIDPDGPTVFDHKSTSDFKWIKTRDDLVDDVQATLYAADAMFRTASPTCLLQWTYVRTRGPRASKKVTAFVGRKEITPRLEKTVLSAAKMSAIIESGAKAADVEKNTKACNDFGGCPYLGICKPFAKENVSMASVADILNKVRAQKNGINPPPVEPPPAPAVQPEASAVPTATPEPAPAPIELPKKRGRPAAVIEGNFATKDEAPVPAAFTSLLNQTATLLENLAKWTRTVAELSTSR